ncbi:MAG TPA: DUF6524 family protein [Hyphomicrobiales bacterium]|nr:DUF6524 family protein [Hyphomicrobiales bacterium]
MSSSYAVVRKKLPVTGSIIRFLAMSFLVLATFNPSYYSIATWIISDTSLLSIKAFTGFALALIWLIVLRMSLAGMGWLGLAYIGMAIAIGALLEWQFGILRHFSVYTQILLAELAFAFAIAFGLVFSFWVRQFAGQSSVVKNPP